jgi:hypothetical protein
MLPVIRIWHRGQASGLTSLDVTHPAWFTESSAAPHLEPRDRAVGLWPIVPKGNFIAVAIVPADLQAKVAINGTAIHSGLHGLSHTDRLDLNGHSVWIAASLSIEPTTYDPAVHGEHKRCFISKAPLEAGQEVVLCPGRPGKPCGVVYAKQSWQRLMESSTRLRCANCDFRPDDAEWRPSEHRPERRINDILDTITNG